MTDLDQEQARASVARAKTSLEAVADELVAQISGRAWLALGYGSWDEMREAEYGGAAVIVPRADRPELVSRIRSEGLSQQQIGDTLGISQQAVSNDLITKNGNEPDDQPDTITNTRGQQRPASYQRDPAKVTNTTRTSESTKVERDVDPETGEIVDEPEPEPEPEPAPAPKPKRKPLPDQFFDASYDTLKVAERLQRLTDDDRFGRNAEQVAARNRSDLSKALDILTDVVNQLPQ